MPAPKDNKRAHHNELERKRRDEMKQEFLNLQNSIPHVRGDKASRQIILKSAINYIIAKRNSIHKEKSAIAELKRKNALLEKQISILESKRGGKTIYQETENEFEEEIDEEQLSEEEEEEESNFYEEIPIEEELEEDEDRYSDEDDQCYNDYDGANVDDQMNISEDSESNSDDEDINIEF